MKKARIDITGQIGNSHNDDGSVSVKGVHLQDIVAQVEEAKKADPTIEGYDVHINSIGGSIDVGQSIAKYIKSLLPNCFTIADTECASMGTEIHLSVPKENRKIIAGCKYTIHCPLMQGVTGNSAELAAYSESIKEYEKDMAKMYVSATGLTKDAVIGLMNQETTMTAEECKSMGFVSEILPAPRLNAFAFFDKPKQQNIDIMKTITQTVNAAFAKFTAELKGVKPVATKYKSKKGILIIAQFGKVAAVGEAASIDGKPAVEGEYETEKEVITIDADGAIAEIAPIEAKIEYVSDKGVLMIDSLEVGSPVMLEGVAAVTGDYTLEDGTIVTVDDAGLIAVVIPPADASTEIAALQAELKTANETIAGMQAEFNTAIEAAVKETKALIGSSYVPKQAVARFGKQQVTANTKDAVAERRSTYKKTTR